MFDIETDRKNDVRKMDINEDDVCHITNLDETGWYCGAPWMPVEGGGASCGEYRGLAVCATCGKPTCPVCAKMEALDALLD